MKINHDTRHLEPHHVIHWADGGETNLDDMVMLCSHHHRLHHEGGYTIHKHRLHKAHADCGFCFRNADGKVIPQAPVYRRAKYEESDWDSWCNTSRDALIALAEYAANDKEAELCLENTSRDAQDTLRPRPSQ